MSRSERAGTYIFAVLCGVLSLGVVVGPELLAGLPRPVAEVTPAPPRTGPPSDSRTLDAAPPAQVPAPTAPPPAVPTPDAPPHTRPATPAAVQPLDRGRQLAHSFYRGQLDQVWAAFLPAVKAQWGSLAALKAYRAGGAQAYGAEKSLLEEQVTRDGGVTYYTRTARFERGPRDGWTLILGLDAQGRVQEFGIVGAGLLPGAPPAGTR